MKDKPPDLIVIGIGNPGPKYELTRHNAGFWFLNKIINDLSLALLKKHKTTLLVECLIEDFKIIIAKPRTYVNETGQAVKYLLTRYQVDVNKLLIVYDDIHLPIGKIRLRATGSSGGHNGIRSIMSNIDSINFPRLRIGVGKPAHDDDQIKYVLGIPTISDKQLIMEAINKAPEIILHILTEGIDATMSRYN